MRQLTPKELDLGWSVSSEKHEEPCAPAVNTVLALFTQTIFPFLSCQSGTGVGTFYCTFTLKEKDTQFPLTKLKDSAINPAATILSSPFALLLNERLCPLLPTTWQAPCHLLCVYPPVLLLLGTKLSAQAVPEYSDTQLDTLSNGWAVRNGHRHCCADGPVRRNWESPEIWLPHAAPQGKPSVLGNSHDFLAPDGRCQGTWETPLEFASTAASAIWASSSSRTCLKSFCLWSTVDCRATKIMLTCFICHSLHRLKWSYCETLQRGTSNRGIKSHQTIVQLTDPPQVQL